MTASPSSPRPAPDNRWTALACAIELSGATRASSAVPAVLANATEIYGWLTGPAGLVITVSPALPQGTVPTTPKGPPVRLTDTQQVVLTVAATDSKGAPVTSGGATLTWSIDNPGVATLTVSADTLSCTVVAGTVGSGVITVSSGSLSGTIAVDVVAGNAAKFTVNEGTPTEQPPTPIAS